MPTRLMFDYTVEWDDRTAQLGGRCRRLSPQQMSTVDQRDSGDGWEERWPPLSTTIERAAADYSNLNESSFNRLLVQIEQNQALSIL